MGEPGLAAGLQVKLKWLRLHSGWAGAWMGLPPDTKSYLRKPDWACSGGLRRWSSSIPCCLPLVKTSNSKGLTRQRMSSLPPQRGRTELAHTHHLGGAVLCWPTL